jgi:hypothetical protein
MVTGSHGIFCSPVVVAVRLVGRRLILHSTSVDAYAVVWRIRLLWCTSGDGGDLDACSGVRRSSFLLLHLSVVGGGRRFVYPLSCEGGGVYHGVTPRCYCSSYNTSTVASTVLIQWLLQYKPNSMKMIFSTNGVGSF